MSSESKQADKATSDSIRSKRKMIAFYIALVLVAAAAASRLTAESSLGLHIYKEAVNPRHPLIQISKDLGPWMQVSVDKRFNPDYEHELGTAEYVFRNYVDSRLLSESERAQLKSLQTLEDREKFFGDHGRVKVDPKGLIRLGLTYYTGSADTVPHVPERCFAADGWTPDNYHVVTWPVLPRSNPEERIANIRMMSFENQISARDFKPQQVCYFFQVNGDYEHDAIFGVRRRLQNIWEAKAYFAKIELATSMNNSDTAEPIMQDFLTNAMPEIERVLPDWKAELAAPVK